LATPFGKSFVINVKEVIKPSNITSISFNIKLLL